MNVIDSGRLLHSGISIFITGNYHGKLKNIKEIPENIQFTGYLSTVNYWSQLLSSDIIMDLTTPEDCLVCGAYEALAIPKPMILSDTKINREYFFTGCIYSKSSSADIAEAILKTSEEINDQITNVKILKEKIQVYWMEKFTNCYKTIHSLS
jgi:hypothetical protein